MASGSTNWVHDKGNVTEKDIQTLQRAKKMEKEDARNGYRWVKVNERLRIFVPCDKEGNPTREGRRRIALLKKSQGIK